MLPVPLMIPAALPGSFDLDLAVGRALALAMTALLVIGLTALWRVILFAPEVARHGVERRSFLRVPRCVLDPRYVRLWVPTGMRGRSDTHDRV